MLTYWDTTNGIDAGRVLGGLLDAGADATLVTAIMTKLTLPRATLFHSRGQSEQGGVPGRMATVAVSPVGKERRLIEAIRATEDGALPLAVRTWGGGMLRRWVEAEALARAVPVDAVPLDDPRTVAELVAVAAALATLRVVRVFAAPLPRRAESREPSHADLVVALLLDEAGWPETDVDAAEIIVTPGGAALLAALAESGPPALSLHAVGYGLGNETMPFSVWLGEPYGTMPARVEDAYSLPHSHPHSSGED